MSKDIDASLWIDFHEFYGNFPLQELLGRNFVVVNENLHTEFAEFKGNVLSYVGTTHCLIMELSCLKCGADPPKPMQLKPLHVLGKIYFLSPYDLDELCEWVRNKRSFFN